MGSALDCEVGVQIADLNRVLIDDAPVQAVRLAETGPMLKLLNDEYFTTITRSSSFLTS